MKTAVSAIAEAAKPDSSATRALLSARERNDIGEIP